MDYLSIVLTLVSLASSSHLETDMAEQTEIDSVPHAGEAPTTIATVQFTIDYE